MQRDKQTNKKTCPRLQACGEHAILQNRSDNSRHRSISRTIRGRIYCCCSVLKMNLCTPRKNKLLLVFLGTVILIVILIINKESVVKSFHRSNLVYLFQKHFLRDSKCWGSPQRQRYVTAAFSGRLGNWMFVYASLLGISMKNKIKFSLQYENPLLSAFKLQFSHVNLQCSVEMYEQKPCAFDATFDTLPEDNVTIHGYLQSWKYFADVQTDVRGAFTFQEYIIKRAREILRIHTRKFSTLDQIISIHVRRQDMMIPSSTRLGFKAAPLEYILNAKAYYKSKFSHQKLAFIVISDDYQWCQRHLSAPDTVVVPTGGRYEDLAVLTLCNHSIITTGTFGWWGAYLAGGEVVYYSNYPEPGSTLDRDTVREDFYPPTWVPLNSAFCIKCSNLLIFVALAVYGLDLYCISRSVFVNKYLLLYWISITFLLFPFN